MKKQKSYVARFLADQFTTSEQYSGEDKAKFANHFVRFVQSDFKETVFPMWFYNRLSMTFGHIALFNREHFFHTFFTNTPNKLHFLQLCSNYPCYGDPAWTYSDVEKALMPFIRDTIRDYVTLEAKEIESAERAELARLSEKYHEKS